MKEDERLTTHSEYRFLRSVRTYNLRGLFKHSDICLTAEFRPSLQQHAGFRTMVDSPHTLFLAVSDIFISEEMPMADRSALECVNQLLQAITGRHDPFSGNIFLGIGDFRQSARIMRSAGKTETIEASIVSFPLWFSFTVLRLDQPIRNAFDPE
jgi:hypothetical protein